MLQKKMYWENVFKFFLINYCCALLKEQPGNIIELKQITEFINSYKNETW